MSDADEVLAHSEDEGEWEDEPVVVERRASGSAVVSARMPRDLANRVFAEAARRGVKPSEVIRDAVERYFVPAVYVSVNVYGSRVRFADANPYGMLNPVVTSDDPNLHTLRTA
jgi:hypothetical protein